MGQMEEVLGNGAGTVRMGRWVIEDIGGRWREGLGLGGRAGEWDGEERDTVFWDVVGKGLVGAGVGRKKGFWGRPETTGGGSSRPSTAFRESCRAKSDACHHSRNLSAKMEVGRRILKLESKRGYTVEAKMKGLKMLFD